MLWVVFLLILLLPSLSEAATTHNAVSCSSTDIQAQIDDVTTISGDTVQIPACGPTTWTNPVYVRKDITLQGMGEGVTNIVDPGNFTPSNFTHNCTLRVTAPCNPGFAALLFVAYTGSNVNLTRITAMTIIGPTSPSGDLGTSNYSIFVVGNGIAKFRVDHITCQPANNGVHGTERCVADYSDDAGASYHSGLVDHVTVYAPTYGGIGFSSVTTFADGALMGTHPVELGTNKSTYYEDNTCIFILGSGDGCWDMYDNASYVVRYNTMTLASSGSHGPDSGLYGSFVAESYRNTWTNSGAAQPYTGNPGRGSFQIMFQETATGNYSVGTEVDIYRAEVPDSTYTGDDVTSTFAYSMTGITTAGQIGVTETVIATGAQTRKTWTSTPSTSPFSVNIGAKTITKTVGGVVTPLPSTVKWTIHRGPQGQPGIPCPLQTLWDRNLGTVGQNNLGYPCFGQIGWSWPPPNNGPGGSICNTNALCTQPNGSNAVYNPTYTWGNRLNGSTYLIGAGPFAGASNYVHINAATAPSKIDIYTDDVTTYGASCTGGGACTAGVGVGTVLPTSCTVGTGFWKTNEGTWNTVGSGTWGNQQGVLYWCDSTNHFSVKYTPYTYPHPLQGSAPTPPSAPTGLQVIGATTATGCTVTWPESTMSGLVGYHLFSGTASGVYDLPTVTKTAALSAAANQPPRLHNFVFPKTGTYYIAVSSFSDTVADSELSAEVTCTATIVARNAATVPRLPSIPRCPVGSSCTSSVTGSNILMETGDKILVEGSTGFVLKEN